MFNAIIDRATGLLGQARGNVAGFPAAPAAQPPAASQRVDAHTQTKKTGGYGTSSAEQAIQAQLLAEATPVSASAPAGAPVWTTGTFTDGAQPAAPGTQQEAAAAAATPGSQPTPPFSSPMAGRSQPPQPPSRRGRARTQRPQQQLRKPAAALYQELSARWRAANPRTQSPSRPNPFSPEGVKNVAAGTTGTNAGVGIQNPLPLPGGHHRQGLTRAELGIPEGAQPRPREEIKSWIQEFFDTRRQQETAATAGGSTGRAPGTPGSRPARLTTPQRPARTAAPTRRNPPVIPGDRPTRQGGVRPMPPPPVATSASSAFPTPVIPTPAQTAAPTIGRRAAANPQVAPRTAPAVSAFPTPVIATPPPAQTSVPVAASPAAGRPATGNTRQLEVQAPWRGPIAGTPLFAPRITPATRGAQQGASASTTAQATTAAPGRRSLRSFWPSQQPRTAPVSTPAATPSRRGAQQLGSQQGRSSSSQARGQPGQQRGWRSRDDLFEPAALDKAGIVAPDSSERPPAPLPTAPSGIDYGTRGDGQSPGSILRKRLADMAQTAGGSDPKRVRWA
ncbi:hypothetical protein VSDG_06528 [Cytospora chrysosperma]|uniref:Uncharacterized protein n=1 Tax=Cytospora chrysosperma TaxID=252740 RepID=A0A423VNX5_CYTCH|nr:hypothetical protein VSDG_06528 [Valsa sordida]